MILVADASALIALSVCDSLHSEKTTLDSAWICEWLSKRAI
jgi:hypothetical protein